MAATTYRPMTSGEAARALSVSQQTARLWARSGKLPAVLTPLGLLFDAGDVERLRLAREQSAETPRIRTRQIGRPTPA